MVDFLDTRRHFRFGTAVDEVDLLGAEAQGHTGGVHRDVAAAEDRHGLAVPEGRVRLVLVVGLHEVRAGEVLVGAEDAREVLAVDAHELRQARARAHEDGVKAVLREEVRNLARTADAVVRLDLHADLLKTLDLVLDDRLRETELRNAVDQDAAALVEGLEHRDLVTGLGAVRRAGDRRGTRTDDRDLLAGLRRAGHGLLVAVLTGEVGAEALDATDCDGLLDVLHQLAHRAFLHALLLLWADASADGREKGGLLDDLERAGEIALSRLREEAGDVDRDGAALHAGLGGALQAAGGLALGHLGRVAKRDFLHVVGALLSVLLGHRLLRNRHSFFRCHD